MITVARLLEVDLMVYVFAACGAISVVLAGLCATQARWQRDHEDPTGFTSDPGE